VDTTQYVDTFELTRSGLEVTGQTPLARFDRLLEDLPEQADTMVVWSVLGERDSLGQFFLRVRVKAAPLVECQRCLTPFEWPVDTYNRLQVVNTEAALEGDDVRDPDQSDDVIERIVGSRRLDVLALIEDEIILSLPYVPKHDVCPSVSGHLAHQGEPEADEGHPSPFAVLGRLKKD
jgi:uncharacterized protein